MVLVFFSSSSARKGWPTTQYISLRKRTYSIYCNDTNGYIYVDFDIQTTNFFLLRSGLVAVSNLKIAICLYSYYGRLYGYFVLLLLLLLVPVRLRLFNSIQGKEEENSSAKNKVNFVRTRSMLSYAKEKQKKTICAITSIDSKLKTSREMTLIIGFYFPFGYTHCQQKYPTNTNNIFNSVVVCIKFSHRIGFLTIDDSLYINWR